ncbi:MAG: sigma-70 family RNA polymerase sigma factor, partial [Endomicrobia bacterium]|nr:sigma-70 family RNA polymerase sigma factor [Endomicrobiia bacterium]
MELPDNVQQILQTYKPISEKALRTFINKYRKTRDEKIKSFIVNSFMWLVVSIAKKFYKRYISSNLDIGDLIEEGTIGLLKAINRYKPYKNHQFVVYATYWIKQSIQIYLKEKPFAAIQLPVSTLRIIKKWIQEWQKIYKKYGRSPTIKEITKKLNLSYHKVKKILHTLDAFSAINSLDTPINEDITLEDTLSDMSLTPEDLLVKISNYETLREAFEKILNKKEYAVIKLRYQNFSKTKKRMSYRKIGKILH